ncbi:uncharacterized protein LOC119445022 [Dermacentor silvarum]|uniref:uncharacterized protein LOC119445022 n=1 Tax=Dermacentor silvarum TaxID=543639 RepID=UPI00189BD6BD|nr:uncharacterized protein LOC119445022 [Dermacentor silvarum]
MPVRISESNRRGEKAWMLLVHILRCAAPPICFSPILLLHDTKSGSAYCLLVVLSMWLLRLLPLPVATCLLSLLLFSLIGVRTQDDNATQAFGVESVLLIACFSLFMAADSTTLSLRTALWLLGVSGARLRPLVVVFMTASFLGALVLPDFLVALVLSSVLEKAVLHLRCKFVSQQFRSSSQAKLQNRRATLSPVHYERLVQEMDSILQRKIQSSPPQSDRDSPTKSASTAPTRSRSERVTLRKMASVMADICGRFTCGAAWAALKGQSSSPDQSPNQTPPKSSDEPPTLLTLSMPPESTRSGSSPSTSTTPPPFVQQQPPIGGLFRKGSPGALHSPPSSPSRGKIRNSGPLSVQSPVVTERLSDPAFRRTERSSTGELQRRKILPDPWDPSRPSARRSSLVSPGRVRPGGSLLGRGSSVVFPAEVGPEERESGSVTAENLAPHWRRGQRLSAIQQMNFGDTADSRSSRKVLVPWNYSRDDPTRSSSRKPNYALID